MFNKNRAALVFVSILCIMLLLTPVFPGKITQSERINQVIDNFFNSNVCSSFDNDSYDLLIITPNKFVFTLNPLVQHKDNVGIDTILVTLEEIYDQLFLPGRDNPERIKYFIKQAHEDWGIKYVMLVGDFRLMPIRYVHNQDVLMGFNEPVFISELYYADLYNQNGSFSTWDSDGDGVFGEWIDDGIAAEAEDKDIDLYPDVYVGRLACRNKLEVKTMVNKIIRYETRTYGSEWFDRLVVCAGDTYPEALDPNWTGYEGEENTLRVIENMSGFDVTQLWTSDGTFTGVRDILSEVNKGCGFLYFDGHANPYRWSTHPPNDPDTWIEGLSVTNMNKLRNRNMYPICVVGGCHNLQFDVHLGKLREEKWYYYTFISQCWGWKLTHKIGGGSIATIGCTGLGMTKEDKESFSGAGDYLEPSFFWEYGVNGTTILGETWGKAISRYLNEYPIDWDTSAAWDSAIDAKTCQQWALLGDPSLQIGGYPS